MSKQIFRLTNPHARLNAVQAVKQAPEGMICELKPRTRSLDANAKMWAMLGDISKQIDWHLNGVAQKLTPEDWKDILSASLNQENRIAQGIRGGFVMLGQRTSRMSVKEMSELIELMYAFGAEHDVKWSERVDMPEWMR